MSKREMIFFLLIIFLISYSWGYEIHNVSNSPYSNSFHADIAIDKNGFLHTVWVEEDSISSHLYYSKSTDDGVNWSIPKKVTNQGYNQWPAISVDSLGKIHIVYLDLSKGATIIYHTSSCDDGNSWSNRIDISRQYEEGWSVSPRFKIDKLDRIHVVWCHDEIDIYTSVYYSISEDGGNSWSCPLELSGEFECAEAPEIAIDRDNNPHVVWFDSRYEFRPKKILYRYYNGNDWSDNLVVHTDDICAILPSISVDSKNVTYFIWLNYGIFFRSFDGTNWSNLNKVSEEHAHWLFGPQLTVDSNDKLIAVWQENRGYWDGDKFSEPFKVKYNFLSENWGEPIILEEGPVRADTVIRVAIDKENYAHIVWSKGDLLNYSREVYHMKFNPYPLIEVQIDIKPGSYPNSINLGSGGNVPVAIFSTTDFDATTIDPITVTLAGASVRLKGKGTPMASFEDVNGDGLLDIVVHVDTTALELAEGDAEAVLEGETYEGTLIRGVDTVRIVNE